MSVSDHTIHIVLLNLKPTGHRIADNTFFVLVVESFFLLYGPLIQTSFATVLGPALFENIKTVLRSTQYMQDARRDGLSTTSKGLSCNNADGRWK